MFKSTDSRLAPVTALLGLLAMAACGGGDPSSNGDGGAQQEACATTFLPLKPGLKWTYQVTDVAMGGGTETKETTVGNLEAVNPSKPSQMAYKITTRKGGTLADETVSWQQLSGKQIARYQEQSYSPGQGGAAPTPTLLEWWDPYKLRLDESRLRQGDKWSITYKEFSRNNGVDAMPRDRNESWEVLGVNVMLTTPAGTYKTLQVRRMGTDQNATSDKQYWFACGVGKIKESGAGGRQELLIKIEGQ